MYNKHKERQSRKGYAISLFYEITPMACKHGRYFFMVKISTISVIKYIIIYVYTIAITSFHGDDGITPDGLRRRLRLCLFIFYRIFRYFSTIFVICNRIVMRCVVASSQLALFARLRACGAFFTGAHGAPLQQFVPFGS